MLVVEIGFDLPESTSRDSLSVALLELYKVQLTKLEQQHKKIRY